MSRFQATARSDTEITKVQPFIKQSERASLGAKEQTSHRLAAVAPLESPFALPNLLNDDDQLLTQTHDVSMRILSLKKRLERYDMMDVFDILFPIGNGTNDNSLLSEKDSAGNDVPVTKSLLTDYSTLTEDAVRHSCLFFQKYGQNYDIENLEWTKELLEASCEPSLRDKTEEKLSQETFHSGGPMYFWHMMQLITSSSEQAAITLIDRLNTMQINTIPGENVLRAVSLLRSAIVRLRLIGKLPTDVRKKVLKVLQTTSVQQFNEIFRIIDITSKFSDATALSVDSILNITEEQFTEMVETKQWIGHGQDASTFVNRNNNRNNNHNANSQNNNNYGNNDYRANSRDAGNRNNNKNSNP